MSVLLLVICQRHPQPYNEMYAGFFGICSAACLQLACILDAHLLCAGDLLRLTLRLSALRGDLDRLRE